MRALFAVAAGGFMLVAAAIPTMPIYVPLVIAAALVTTGGAWLVWPWIVDRSGIDALGNEFEPEPADDWRDDGSGERRSWGSADLRGLSPHNAWITAPDDRGFVADSSATAEIAAPVALVAAEPTVIYDTGLFDLRLRRPKGKRRAGVR